MRPGLQGCWPGHGEPGTRSRAPGSTRNRHLAVYCQELLGHKTGGRGRAGRAASPPPRGGVWPGRQRAGVRQMPPGRAGETKAPRGAGAGGPGVRPFLQQPLPSLESWAPLAQPLVATTRASECQAWVGGASGTRGWRQKASEQRRSRGPGAGARRAPPASLPPTPAVYPRSPMGPRRWPHSALHWTDRGPEGREGPPGSPASKMEQEMGFGAQGRTQASPPAPWITSAQPFLSGPQFPQLCVGPVS